MARDVSRSADTGDWMGAGERGRAAVEVPLVGGTDSYFKQRLWDDGRGTRIEIYPVDQQHVAPNRRRNLNIRTINVRTDWRRVVDAWNSGDQQALDDAWHSIADSLGSDHAAYRHVSHVGFGI